MILVQIALRMDEKCERMDQRTKDLQRMGSLAKQGLKDTDEYRALEFKRSHPTVTDFGDEMQDLRRVVKQLKRYKL